MITPIQQVLKVFSDRVSVYTDLNWSIAGSTASLIQGCNNIGPNDIDILVKQNGDVDKIVNLWAFARLNIHGIIIEMANTVSDEYLELSPVVWELKRYEELFGMLIPVVPLGLQLYSSYEQQKPDRDKAICEVIKLKNLDLQFMENYLSSSSYRQLIEQFR
ncbi:MULTISPECIES: hypothetical protein [unclassified Paenibacillus]|uniref:hypothetical protein n=1 Tax=unclassified Paenibacillus TaxID=185978 RepID=UPI0009A8DC1E|nr:MULTISPECIES: hypothetical protein [unclassified Paenibacillus]SLJ92289.1 hypothetical protein SAMN06272722_1011021 [Paenibacillus sp. RU5A]SOC58627.1 hypothetical protein SAMN05880581_101169 [Paenibacillus sp. RU26A]SOC67679.1 hypothetical protein SAMN05880586_101169 [Paenibacillus sp. RU5M]